MISNKYVDEYINLWKQGKIILNKERIDLFNYLQKHIYSRDDVYFDEQKIEDCIKFIEKWYFPTLPFQRFIIANIFLIVKIQMKLSLQNLLFSWDVEAGKTV